MTVNNNSLVLYKGKGAVVTEISGDKYSIRTANGDRKSVRLKDIEPVHPGPCSSVPSPADIPSAEVQAENSELMGDETMDFAEFTELLFGDFSPSSALAAAELISIDFYFSGSVSSGVRANSSEHVRSREMKEQLKNARKDAHAELLERIRSCRVVPEDSSRLREIENVAYGESPSSKLMHDLDIEVLPEKAQGLLTRLGVWNEFDNNPWPRRYSIPVDLEYPPFPDTVPDEERADLTHLAAYAIDDIGSTDPDDAISYDRETGLVWIHVADPSSVVRAGSGLEAFAMELGCTLYLPEGVTVMLPAESVGIFGLGLNEISPALSFGIRIDESGKPSLERMTLSRVRVTRMNYDEAGALMDSEEFAPCAEAVWRFRDLRIRNRAVMIRLPETGLRVNIPERSISIKQTGFSEVREMVANAMIAAGHAVAVYAAENHIALPYAVQEEPEMTERPDTIYGMYELRRNCRTSNLSVIPGLHAGLGLEPYVRVTSPMRRYEDLLSHIQLRRFMAGEELLSAAEINERIICAAPAASGRAKLERQCKEYWTLVYLKNHEGNWKGEAVCVAHTEDRNVMLIPELAYEFKLSGRFRLALGEKVRIECTSADPVTMSSHFRVTGK